MAPEWKEVYLEQGHLFAYVRESNLQDVGTSRYESHLFLYKGGGGFLSQPADFDPLFSHLWIQQWSLSFNIDIKPGFVCVCACVRQKCLGTLLGNYCPYLKKQFDTYRIL